MNVLRVSILVAVSIVALGTSVVNAQSSRPDQAVYVVFEVEGGSARLVSAQMVSTHGPGGPPSASEALGPHRAGLRVLDGTDTVVYETTASGGALRGEYHGRPRAEGGWSIESHHLRAERWAFSVLIPEGPLTDDGIIEVSVSDSDLRSSGGALLLPVSDLRALVQMSPRRSASVRPLYGAGDPANRVDILVIGDGYTAAQEDQFLDDAARVAEGVLDVEPFREYRRAFTATALFVPSNEAGADQPAGVGDCAGSGRYVDTAFDATYCTQKKDPLLTVNMAKVLTAAGAYPEWDQILVVVNDTKYGGSGGPWSVTSMHGMALDIARHEMGHSFGRLADEYVYRKATCWEPGCPPNVTSSPHRGALKWAPWVADETPLPTPDSVAYNNVVGAFEGAISPEGLYRPHRNCMMRSLGFPYCPVCREHLVRRLYEGGWSRTRVSRIGSVEPSSEQPAVGDTVSVSGPTTFSVDFLDPAGGPPLNVEWRVGGVVASTDRTFTFSPDSAGTYTVALTVSDPTPFVHPDRDRTFLTSTRVWIVVPTMAVGAEGEGDRLGFLLGTPSPNPSSSQATARVSLGEPSYVRLTVYDLLGRVVSMPHDGPLPAGEHEVRIDIRSLGPGTYFVRASAGTRSRAVQMSVVR